MRLRICTGGVEVEGIPLFIMFIVDLLSWVPWKTLQRSNIATRSSDPNLRNNVYTSLSLRRDLRCCQWWLPLEAHWSRCSLRQNEPFVNVSSSWDFPSTCIFSISILTHSIKFINILCWLRILEVRNSYILLPHEVFRNIIRNTLRFMIETKSPSLIGFWSKSVFSKLCLTESSLFKFLGTSQCAQWCLERIRWDWIVSISISSFWRFELIYLFSILNWDLLGRCKIIVNAAACITWNTCSVAKWYRWLAILFSYFI